MPYQIDRMTKIEFDGFISFLEACMFFEVPYFENNEEGLKAAGEHSIVSRLIADSDYGHVYNHYKRYRIFRNMSDGASSLRKNYKDELYALRDQCKVI